MQLIFHAKTGPLSTVNSVKMYEAQLTQKSLSSQASVNMMRVFKVEMSQCIKYKKKKNESGVKTF